MAFEALLHELNRLQRRLYESYREFNTTIDNLETDRWKTHFAAQAKKRKYYYEAIRETIKGYGSTPKDITHPFSDAADEIFTDVKTFLTGEDDKFILQEALLKERKLIEAYQQALAVKTVDEKLRNVLEPQLQEVERELGEIQAGLDEIARHS